MAKIVLDDPEIYQDRDFLNLICQLSPRVFESIDEWSFWDVYFK